MKFSVLMSLYIKEKPEFLDDCFKSLHLQTVNPDEIVLVIDGEITDELILIIHKWQEVMNVKVFPLPNNVGLGKALHFGLGKCVNNLVARMDTDDICELNRFEKQIEAFKLNPDLSICGSYITEVDPFTLECISVRKVPLSNKDIYKQILKSNPFNHMTVMYNKKHIIQVGNYKHLPFMEDWYLWLRLVNSGFEGLNIPVCLVKARTGESMLTRRSGFEYIKSEWLITKKKIALINNSTCKSLYYFIKRSIPRLFPQKIIYLFYKISRM
ncbi:glycosyltransferase [Shewanella sp. 4_MG-2023]|uniref:glycosyltransferase n=1 Tax=Shewanella sp. 4_MG-2023 TaxID=3062652 RepID=UPI0026E34DFE|nr:glycosyltransferase [Shewanella sp. 4_MG-2023]MDO6678455.1 glycosyltransferase [Shewanella sp. 4_MG-2023]